MNARKVVAGSVLAAGLGASGLFGAGTAFAGPGVSFDNGSGGTNTVGFGDQSAATGATANASEGNRALAINITSKNGTQAIAQGQNNNVVSIDGVATTGKDTKHNNVVNASASPRWAEGREEHADRGRPCRSRVSVITWSRWAAPPSPTSTRTTTPSSTRVASSGPWARR